MSALFEHITVPVDGSATAERGIAFALHLAAGGGAVTFCSVVDPTWVCLPAAEGVALDPGPMLAALDENAASFCREAAGRAAAAGIVADIQTLHGSCVQAVETLSRHNGSDALVIGTHGRTGLTRTLLGSVAEGLLRASDVPVVIVHEDDLDRSGPIIVATDASPAAQAALDEAIVIARSRGLSLILVHVRGESNEAASEADVVLRAAAEHALSHGVQASPVMRRGHPSEELLRVADEQSASMIVMGTHGRALVARLLGSVAAAVVQGARVPVVTVRRSGRRPPRNVSAPSHEALGARASHVALSHPARALV